MCGSSEATGLTTPVVESHRLVSKATFQSAPDRRLDAGQVAANVTDQDIFDDPLRCDLRVEEGKVASARQCFIAQPADNRTRLRPATV